MRSYAQKFIIIPRDNVFYTFIAFPSKKKFVKNNDDV